MKRGKVAKVLGLTSVACALAFWVCAGIFLFTPIGQRSGWMLHVMVAFPVWLTIWAIGLLLALIAAATSERGWLFAAVLNLGSAGVAMWLVSGIQW